MVYLIAEPTVKRDATRPDLSSLAHYGEVQVCLPSGMYPSVTPDKAFDLLHHRLTAFNPTTDYLAWAGGDTLAAVMTGVVLADLGLDHVRWLRWQRGWTVDGKRCGSDQGSYRLVEVDL